MKYKDGPRTERVKPNSQLQMTENRRTFPKLNYFIIWASLTIYVIAVSGILFSFEAVYVYGSSRKSVTQFLCCCVAVHAAARHVLSSQTELYAACESNAGIADSQVNHTFK